MVTSNMRHTARECVSRARKFLAHGDEASARHACLELRFAIEYIIYDLVQAYREELPYDALKKWTPRQVISELLAVDPHADQSSTVLIGLEHEYGVKPPAGEMQLLGEDRRFSLRWANKNHNALGNFLHAPTIHQLESGGAPTAAAIIQKATEVADVCEHNLNSPLFNVNFGQFLNFECEDCKTHFRKREGSVTPEQGVVCPQCHATYDIESTEGDNRFTYHLRRSTYKCTPCGAENSLGTHRVVDGAILECEQCSKKARIEKKFHIIWDDPQPLVGDK